MPLSGAVPVLLVHADAAVQGWVREALPASEFALTVRSAAEDWRALLVAEQPRVILMDARLGLADKRLGGIALELDPPAHLLALVAPEASASASQALECGAHDALVLPATGALLHAKLRAAMRWLRRTLTAYEARGEIEPEGPLVLIKHCEDHRLSGRLTVTDGGRRYWVDFFGGELVATGSDTPSEEGDDLASLMSLRAGSYRFAQRAVGPLAPVREEAATAGAHQETPAALAPPDAIVATVGGALPQSTYEVRTSGENRPFFTITTVVERGGEVLRRTETAWPHPIESDADVAQARLQMEQQHERVSAKLRELAETPAAAAAAGAATAGVDGTLLSWALHLVVDQAWADLGTNVTANLLGRTQDALRRKWPHLAHFRIGEKAQVAFDLSHGTKLASDAVDAVAIWLASFLYLARRVVPELAKIDVRQCTVLMDAPLERVGFYAAYAVAAARCERDGVQLGGVPFERGAPRP